MEWFEDGMEHKKLAGDTATQLTQAGQRDIQIFSLFHHLSSKNSFTTIINQKIKPPWETKTANEPRADNRASS